MIIASLLLTAAFHVDFRDTNVNFDSETGAFTVEDVRAPGRICFRGEIDLPRGTASVPDIPKYRIDGERGVVTFDDAGRKSEIVLDASYDGVKIIAPKGCAISGEVVAGEPDDGTAVFALAKDALPAGLEAASGPAVPQGADAVFDRRADALYAVDGAKIAYSYEHRRYTFGGTGEVKLSYCGGYLADKYRIAYHPVNTNATFRTPPVGWMTWYAVKFDACDHVVMENAKAFREKFGGYTDERPALWVDWEWFHEKMGSRGEEDHDMMSPRKTAYPRGMKAVADDLKGLGFTPALWVSLVCDVRTNAMWKVHPEWILGTKDNWSGANWADPTAPGFCEKFIPEMFDLYRSWGYEAFKWDCLYNALWFFAKFRDRAHDPSMTSEEVFRRMLAAGRKAVGPDTYLEGCAGLTDRVILGAIDILDSSRVGNDIFNWAEFLYTGVNRILNYYPFHQTAFYADADNLVLRPEFSNEAQARTRVSVYGLSGVPITVGDRMSALDDRRVDMLRRVMPVVPTHPATLGRDICRGTDLDLRVDIRRPYGSWQVRGWSNFATNAVRRVKFAPAGAAVWDFWNDRLLTETEFDVAPCDTRVVRVTPVEKEGPTLLSVSRHITQGGYELARYFADATGAAGVVRCPGGETVKVTFLLPEGAKVASASHPYDLDGRVLRLKLGSTARADVAFDLRLDDTRIDRKAFRGDWRLPERTRAEVKRHDGTDGVYRYANILWTERGIDSRFPDMDPVLPFEAQLKACDRYGLPRTVLFTYDALFRDDMLDVARRHPGVRTSYGVWYEVMEMMCRDAGIAWKSSHRGWTWDWHVNPGHSMAYTQDERKRLADVTMRKFKAVFGSYPKTVAAWMLDAWTIDYMRRTYGIESFAFCREQDSIDAYGYRGGYFGGAYYPSRVNHLSAAVDFENAVDAPVFRMYTTCPIYTYGFAQEQFARKGWCGTFEPVWLTGHHPETVNWAMDQHYEAPGLLNFSGIITGQENIPWNWGKQSVGVENVCREIARRWKLGEFEVETMDETARKFRRLFPDGNPAVTQVCPEDWAGLGHQTYWYNCRHYRLNVHRTGSRVFIRDCHKMDDAYAEKYYEAPCKAWNAEYFTPPVFDTHMFGDTRDFGDGVAVGGAELDGEFESVESVAQGRDALKITAKRRDGTVATVLADECGFTVEGATLRYRQKGNVKGFAWTRTKSGLAFDYEGFRYSVGVTGEWADVSATGWTLRPSGGRIRFTMDAPSADPRAKGAEKVLEDGARVVFFGDSITHHGWWSLAISDWCFAKYPDRRYTFVNAGIGGDTSARAVARVAEDVAPADPTVVVMMFGMNDTWLTPEAYGANLERLRAELRARCPKAQLVWFTPSPYDPTVPEKPVAGKAERLVEFAAVVRAFAARTGDACIDMNGPMTAYNLLRQRTDPKFSLCGKDGVHPRIDGGRHMGRLFLRAIGEDATMEELGRLNDSSIGQLNRKIRDKLDMRQCYGMLRHFLLRKYLGERMDDLEAVKELREKCAADPKVTKDYCWKFIDSYIRDWPAREKLTAEVNDLYAQIECQRGGLRK